MYNYLLIILSFLYPKMCQSQEESININIKKGEMYSLNYTLQTVTRGNGFDTSYTMTIKIESGLIMKVQEVETDEYKMLVYYNYMGLYMHSPGKSVALNSNITDTKGIDSVDKFFLKVFETLLNKPFTMSISKTGQISVIEGLDDAIQALIITDGGDINTRINSATQMFGSAMLYLNLGYINNIYPSKNVAQSSTWENKLSLTNNTQAYFLNTYKYQSKNNSNLEISGNGHLENYQDIKNAYLDAENVEVTGKYNINATLAANTYFPIKVNMHQVINTNRISNIKPPLKGTKKIIVKLTIDAEYTGSKIDY